MFAEEPAGVDVDGSSCGGLLDEKKTLKSFTTTNWMKSSSCVCDGEMDDDGAPVQGSKLLDVDAAALA